MGARKIPLLAALSRLRQRRKPTYRPPISTSGSSRSQAKACSTLAGRHTKESSTQKEVIYCVGREESLRRKDAIIRVRNAQISALWDEIHTKQPWRNALDQDSMLDLPGDAQNASRALVVFGINTVRPTLPAIACVSEHRPYSALDEFIRTE